MARLLCTTVVVALAATLACARERPSCYDGDHVGCTCTGNVHGYQVCGAGDYGACVCDGTTPGLDASAPVTPKAPVVDAADEAAVEAGAKKGFLAACANADECESGLCQNYPSKGSFCSRHCTAATASVDCPPPSPGCNPQEVCKAP